MVSSRGRRARTLRRSAQAQRRRAAAARQPSAGNPARGHPTLSRCRRLRRIPPSGRRGPPPDPDPDPDPPARPRPRSRPTGIDPPPPCLCLLSVGGLVGAVVHHGRAGSRRARRAPALRGRGRTGIRSCIRPGRSPARAELRGRASRLTTARPASQQPAGREGARRIIGWGSHQTGSSTAMRTRVCARVWICGWMGWFDGTGHAAFFLASFFFVFLSCRLRWGSKHWHARFQL